MKPQNSNFTESQGSLPDNPKYMWCDGCYLIPNFRDKWQDAYSPSEDKPGADGYVRRNVII